MTKRILPLTVILLFCLFACGRAEGNMVSAVAAEYGQWSAWTDEEILPAKDVEIERELRSRVNDVFEWKYTRYVYFDEEKGKWFSVGSENGIEGRRWEEKTSDEALDEVGDGIFEGGWFNEEVTSRQVVSEGYEYRSRVVKRVTCEVSTNEILVLPEKNYKLEVNFFDDSEKNTYVSSDQTVATVDQTGNVLGVAVGAAQITVTSSKGRMVVIDVYVCKTGAALSEGVYTFRLLGTNKTMSVGKRISSKSDNVIVAQFDGGKNQRFIVSNLSNRTFILQPLTNKNWFLDIARKNKALSQGQNVQIHSRKDRTSQYLRALYVPDGSYIIYPKSDAGLVIGAEPDEAGNNVRLETMNRPDSLENVDRWIPIRTNQTGAAADFIRPVAQDGTSFVKSEFGSDTRFSNGLFFASNERRVFITACAAGKVLAVSNGCAHDYAKVPNATGELIDPCSASSESIGNYVIIDHGKGMVCLYAYMSQVFVSEGDEVIQGTLLGKSGATGSAEQVGLYLEMRKDNVPVNPRDYIKLPDTNRPIGE